MNVSKKDCVGDGRVQGNRCRDRKKLRCWRRQRNCELRHQQARRRANGGDHRCRGWPCESRPGRLSKKEDIRRAFADIGETAKTLDTLVNNAGVYANPTIEKVTAAEFHRQFNLNVLGVLLSTKAAVPMFGDRGGAIINIGFGVAQMAPPFSSIYAATKGAVNSMTVALSKELGGRKIRVKSLNPGLVETERSASEEPATQAFYDFLVTERPLGRFGRPDDIANVAVFLASDATYWVNGKGIVVADGQTM